MKLSSPFALRHPVTLARAALGVALASVAPSCIERTDDLGATGSETHFLIECSETCAAGLDCIDGVCTSPCSSDASCAIWSAAAVCSAEPSAPEPGVCDVQCAVAADCAPLGAGYRCEAGSCRSAPSVGASGAAASLPLAFDVLEVRRIDNDVPPDPGSNCDPAEFTVAYFVDLPARQMSWANCYDDERNNIWLRSAGSLPLEEADRDYLIAAYGQLQVGVSESCFGSGGTFLDVTTADSARFAYGDESFTPCDVERLGRVPVANLLPLTTSLAELVADGPRGLPREGSTER